MTDASVMLWGRRIGAVAWDPDGGVGTFQYDPDFVGLGVEPSPLEMPARTAPYRFPHLERETFKGLPGMLSDALPDRFGNSLIDAWLAETGQRPEDFDPVMRLCYVGTRGTGALEFKPAIRRPRKSRRLDVGRLVDLANSVTGERAGLSGRPGASRGAEALEDILEVGASAGGARAKAVLAWNPATGEFRSGQAGAGPGFEHWLLKFDGVSGDGGRELAAPTGYGLIEYAYFLMARAAGISMSDCRLHREGGRSHFMTRRFDRDANGGKIHMQSLGALRHYDFNAPPPSCSHEQAVMAIRDLGLGMEAIEEQFRRAVFNAMARNQDDHVKNISFLMDRGGNWSLSPAYDVAYAYNPRGTWTRAHQMSLAGKRDGFETGDLLAFAGNIGVKRTRARRLVGEVRDSVLRWREHAEEAGVAGKDVPRVERALRLELGERPAG